MQTRFLYPSDKMALDPSGVVSEHSAGSTLVPACAALGDGHLGFMEVKSGISPQPPIARNYFFWRAWRREDS